MNTDQGSQYIGSAFIGVLANNGIAISVFVEQLWRSVEYEEVYLRAYDSVGGARLSIEDVGKLVKARRSANQQMEYRRRNSRTDMEVQIPWRAGDEKLIALCP